ncbi:TSUP family transporter [Candidatus Peregrinibacteria bacterium]|nr:TSUP family transporter [Candidatus Peregrinibacteria bacterium]
MSIEFFILIIVLAFILEFLDASVGMGYGNLTPLLILLGMDPIDSVLAVLFSSVILSTLTGILHHIFKNVDFGIKKKSIKVSFVLIGFGVVGILIGVLTAVRIPEIILKSYIGLLVLIIGFIVIFRKKKKYKFSWLKLIGLGSLASFNQGMSGGGYGPVLAGGQIVAGVESKKAVAITGLTEGIISIVGVIAYLSINQSFEFVNWHLIIAILSGGIVSTPIAVYAVKKMDSSKLKVAIGIFSIVLGLLTLIKIFI